MKFDIWSADVLPGVYRCRHYHGTQEAENFQKACYEFAADHPEFKRYFNPTMLAYKGFHLFPTEQEVLDSYDSFSK